MADGYTKINNKIMKTLFSGRFNISELQTLLFIIRYTIGFSRSEAELSYGFIAKGTGMNVRTVQRAVASLVDKKIITISQKAMGIHPQKITLSVGHLTDGRFDALGSVDLTQTVGHSTDSSVGHLTDQERKQRKHKKEKERKENPSFSSIEEANEWFRNHPDEEDDEYEYL